MGNYLSSRDVAYRGDLSRYLTTEEAQRSYATNSDFRAEVDRLVAENDRLNLQHTDFISGTFNPLSTRVGTLRTDVDTLRTDANGLRTDVDTLRTDTNGLRTDLTTLQTNYGTLNTNFNSLDSAYNGFVENQFNTLLNQVGELRTNYATLSETVNANNNALNTTATNLETLQGQFNTLNTNYNTHIQNYNQFSAGIRQDLGSQILALKNEFDSELGTKASLEYVEGLNNAVQSGLSAEEVSAIKDMFKSTEFGDALQSLGIKIQRKNQEQNTTTTQTNPSSYLRTRNYMLY
jgi:chromosome segregation ATPase